MLEDAQVSLLLSQPGMANKRVAAAADSIFIRFASFGVCVLPSLKRCVFKNVNVFDRLTHAVVNADRVFGLGKEKPTGGRHSGNVA